MHLAAVTFPSHPVHLFSSFTVSVKKRHAAFVGMDPRTQLQMLFLTPLDPPNSGVRSSSFMLNDISINKTRNRSQSGKQNTVKSGNPLAHSPMGPVEATKAC
ncbi:hypothetical protein HYE68_002163 [Fusarium pseudograminearum]|nr:hypothetical protein HYE68_002163 [Fusarium pseudograminearum]